MFKGVIHANARAILPEFIQKMPGRVINICSGNFTLETTIRMNGYAGSLQGCDVSLYTSALGEYFAGRKLDAKLRDTADPDLQVFGKHMEDGIGVAAVVAIVLDLSEHAPRKNEFQKRIWRAMILQAEKLVLETRKRLETKKAKIQLNDFHSRDGVEVIKSVTNAPDTLLISSPPTYEGGYEKLYAWMEATFEWPKPQYTDIGPAKDFAELIVGAGTDWMLFTEDRRQDVEEVVGKPIAQAARGPNKNVYLYSNLGVKPKLVRRKVECADEPKWPRLTDRDTISESSKLEFHRINFKEANYIRQLYSSVIVTQASAQFCYAFTLEGKLFGIAMFSLATFDPLVNGKSIGGEYIYMMCDLPVASEKHQRLSKLVLACTTAKEFQHELEHRVTQKVNWIFTTAFSENPVSMKYRGAYDFHSRKPKDANGHYSINYVARIGKKGLKELFRVWFTKHYRQGSDLT